MLTRVVNVRCSAYDVLIDRTSVFGNPYRLEAGTLAARMRAIEQFRLYFIARLRDDAEYREAVLKLRGRVLGCHCVPLPCHGHVIASYLDEEEENTILGAQCGRAV